MSTRSKKDFHNILGLCEKRCWHNVANTPYRYLWEIVWEFYSSYRARLEQQELQGKPDHHIDVTSISVRGKEVAITPDAFFHCCWPSTPIPKSNPIASRIATDIYMHGWPQSFQQAHQYGHILKIKFTIKTYFVKLKCGLTSYDRI